MKSVKDLIYVYEWTDEEDNDQNLSIIRMFGVNSKKKSVMVKIENFSPFCFMELPDTIKWNNTNLGILDNIIKEQYRTCKPIHMSFEMKKRLYHSKFCYDEETQTYKDKTFPYLKMTFQNVSKMNQFIAYTRKGITSGALGRLIVKIYGAERSLLPSLQFMGSRKIASVGWIRIDNAVMVESMDKESTKNIEYIVDYQKVVAINKPEIISKLPIVYPSILSFDIETYSSRIVCMPDSSIPLDCVFQIGCTLRERNGKVKKYLFTLKECDEIEDVTVFKCKSERKMLEQYAKFVVEKDPDIIIGYNIYGFDFTYMIKRAEVSRCYESFMKQGCILGKVCKKGGLEWESSAYGKQTINYVQADGRLVFDMLPYIRKSFRLTNYKLETVCEEFLKTNKDPLKYTDIFNCYIKGDGKSMALCGKYCVQDSYVVYLLFEKLYTWYDITESAITNQVPMFYLYAKGQQIKMFAQVFSYCYHNNIVMNVQNTLKTEKYTGATVLNPIPGIYTNVLPFDFASLYPSIIMAYNIDYSRCLTDEDDIPDSACHIFDWEEHSGCQHDPNRKIHKKDSAIQKAEEKKICSHFRYRYMKTESCGKGVIPTILYNLISARKNVRKILEINQQEYEILQKVIEDKELTEEEKSKTSVDLENKESIKKRMDEIDVLKIVMDKRQISYKVNANSMYGAMGVSRGFLPLKHGAMTVTYIGRKSIEKAVNFIKTNWEGANVVYGDTDSCFVKFPQLEGKTNREIWSFAENVVSKVKEIFPDPMKLEFEGKINASYFILTKKRYVSQSSDVNGVLDKKITKKGVALQRRDNCKLLKDIYENAIQILIKHTNEVQYIKNKSMKEIMKSPITLEMIGSIMEYMNMCFNMQYSYKDFVITKGLNRSEYKGKTIPPHAALAQKLENRGIPVPVNTRLEFLYINIDKKNKLQQDIIEELNYFKEHRDVLRIDYIYYLEHQIVKPIDEILKIAFGIENFMKKHTELRKLKQEVNKQILTIFSPQIKIIF